jgi:hypothetical protein
LFAIEQGTQQVLLQYNALPHRFEARGERLCPLGGTKTEHALLAFTREQGAVRPLFSRALALAKKRFTLASAGSTIRIFCFARSI